MALTSEMMAQSMPSGLANCIGHDTPGTGLSGAGTTQADALVLKSSFNVFTTTNSGTGAILPSASGQQDHVIFNGGANALLVYAAVGQVINNIATTSGFSVTAGKSAYFTCAGTQWIAVLSA